MSERCWVRAIAKGDVEEEDLVGLKLEGRWIQNGLRTPFVLTKVAAQ